MIQGDIAIKPILNVIFDFWFFMNRIWCAYLKKNQIILETWFIYILGIGQHRHLKFIAKHHNYFIVLDNRLFLLQFQHGPKSISMYNVHCMYIVLQPSKTIGVYNLHCRCMPLLLKRFIYIALGEKRIGTYIFPR